MAYTTQCRLGQQSDLVTVFEIYNYEVAHGVATFDYDPVPAHEQLAWWHSCNRDLFPLVVAEVEGVVRGWASVSPWGKRPGYRRSAEVSVYVDHRHRGRGIGSTLLSDLIRHAQERNYVTLISRINDDDSGLASQLIHMKLGFRSVGVIRASGEKFGRLIDTRLYQLLLSSEEDRSGG